MISRGIGKVSDLCRAMGNCPAIVKSGGVMRLGKILVFFMVVVVGRSSLAMTQAGNSTEGLLDGCRQAMGGGHAGGFFYGEGTVSYSGGAPVPVVWKSQGQDLFREEVKENGETNVEVVNQGHGFRLRQGKRHETAAHETAYFRQEYIPALLCGVERDRAGIVAEDLGSEQIEGQKVRHIRFSIAPKGQDRHADEYAQTVSEYHVFLDPASHVVVGTRRWIFSPDRAANRSVWETYYHDYRVVDGVLMPFHIENRLGGQKAREIVLTTVRRDDSITSGDFQ
jgi:hypothetical protein